MSKIRIMVAVGVLVLGIASVGVGAGPPRGDGLPPTAAPLPGGRPLLPPAPGGARPGYADELLVMPPVGPVTVDQAQARELREAGVIRPLEDITDHALHRYPGRVLEVELEQEAGRFLYEVELLDRRGVVWKLHYDATSGVLVRDKKK